MKKLPAFWIIGGWILFYIFLLPLPPCKVLSLRIGDLANSFSLSSENPVFFNDIVVILVDDESLRSLASKWPLSRNIYAQLLGILNDEHAAVVGFDLVFGGKGALEEDAALDKAISDFKGEMVFAYYVDKKLQKPSLLEGIRRNAHTAFVNTPSDQDGRVRRVRAYIQVKEASFFDYSFPVKTASLFLGRPLAFKEEEVSAGSIAVPVDTRDKTFHIQYFAVPWSRSSSRAADEPLIKRIALGEVLIGKYPAGYFEGKIVLVGASAAITHDLLDTPFGRGIPGVYVHVNGILNILHNRVVKILPLAPFLCFFGLTVLFWSSSGFHLKRALFAGATYLFSLFWVNLVAMRFFNRGFEYGEVAVFITGCMALLGLYSSAFFAAGLRRARAKAVNDPFYGLYIFKYFCYRLALQKKELYLFRKKYLLCILLERFFPETKKVGFGRLKETWQRIDCLLKDEKGAFWGTFTEDKIVGFVLLKKAGQPQPWCEALRESLEKIFQGEGIAIPVRVGWRQLKNADFSLPFERAVPWYFQKIQGSGAAVCSLDEVALPDDAGHELQQERTSDFEENIEEKNKKLLGLIEELKKEQQQREKAYFELLGALVNALEAKDEYTKGHSQRVSNYAVMLSRQLRLPEEEIDTIRKAGTMHDVGKIGLPDSILHKRGKLNDEEYTIVRRHAQMGANIIAPIHYFKHIIPYILHHHERYDGNGYPDGLKGDAIPLGAQIMAVADVFDALTTARDYKPAYSLEDAVKELRRVQGTQFNPRLIDAFVQMLSEKGMMTRGPGT